MQPSSSNDSLICEEEKVSRAERVSQADTGAVEYLQKIYFEMSEAQFGTLLNMLEVHIKKNSTPITTIQLILNQKWKHDRHIHMATLHCASGNDLQKKRSRLFYSQIN